MYKISPSKAHRYLQCTASLKYDKPFTETPASIRGTQLHDIAEKILKKHEPQKLYDEFELNDYERFLIDSYVSNVLQEYDKINGKQLVVEEKTSTSIFGLNLNMIIDTLIIGKRRAMVIDLKTGNFDVDPKDNPQLLFYGYGVVMKYPKLDKLQLSIFQKGKMKSVEITKGEIMDFFIDKAETFEKIRNNELEYNPSESACKFCDYKDKCPARAKWILERNNGK